MAGKPLWNDFINFSFIILLPPLSTDSPRSSLPTPLFALVREPCISSARPVHIGPTPHGPGLPTTTSCTPTTDSDSTSQLPVSGTTNTLSRPSWLSRRSTTWGRGTALAVKISLTWLTNQANILMPCDAAIRRTLDAVLPLNLPIKKVESPSSQTTYWPRRFSLLTVCLGESTLEKSSPPMQTTPIRRLVIVSLFFSLRPCDGE